MRVLVLCLALLALLALAALSPVAASRAEEDRLEAEVDQLELGLLEVEAEADSEASPAADFPAPNTAGTDKCVGDACAGALAQSAPSLAGEHNGPIDTTA